MTIAQIILLTISIWVLLLIVLFILSLIFECFDGILSIFWYLSKCVFVVIIIGCIFLPTSSRYKKSYRSRSYRSSYNSSSNSGGSRGNYSGGYARTSNGKKHYFINYEPNEPDNQKLINSLTVGERYGVKTKRDWENLSEAEQWECIKSICKLEILCVLTIKEKELKDPNNIELKELKEDRKWVKKRREKLFSWWK